MFPLSKLGELSPRTRLRKAARILQGIEIDLQRGESVDAGYLAALAGVLRDPGLQVSGPAAALLDALAAGAGHTMLLRPVNDLRNALLSAVGGEPSEWDLLGPGGMLDRAGVRVSPVCAYLEDIRSPFNVGSLFRTAEAFGMERLILSPRTPRPTHPRAARTARGAAGVVPWSVGELADLPEGPVFALELGGTPIDSFAFPARGTVLVGSEELGLSPEALARADAGLGRVSIPLAGAKRSLNVSVAFGILVSRWFSRLG
jgi:RNA methyltransferase, TrmH family